MLTNLLDAKGTTDQKKSDLEKIISDDKPDLSQALFWVTMVYRLDRKKYSRNFSEMSKKILLDYNNYISPELCSDIVKRYSFLIRRSLWSVILLTVVTLIFFIYAGTEALANIALVALLSPLIFNLYNEALMCMQILFFDPNKFIPAVTSDIDSLKSTAVIIASRNEPFEVAKMTFDSAISLIASKGKKEIIVVDNSDVSFAEYLPWKNYVESFCDGGSRKILGVRVIFIHREGVSGFKPRNLDIALGFVTAEFILYLDVDSTVYAETLLRVLPVFERDEKLGFIQLYTSPTNVRGKSNLALAQGIRNYFLRFMTVFNTHTSHSLFYGHNAIWRTSLVRKMGSCLEYHRGEIVVTEDLSMSFRARSHGYYGVGVWLESGEWVPESMRETEAMWLRWTVGTYQVYRKHFAELIQQRKINWQEFLGWVQHIGIFINYGLVPIYLGMGLLFNSTPLMGMVALSLLSEFVQAVCAFSKISLNKMNPFVKIMKCYSAFLVLGTFINWIRFIGLFRYLTGKKQGWTPTGKSTEGKISFSQLIKDRYIYMLFGLACSLYSIYSATQLTETMIQTTLTLLCGFYGLNSLLSLYFFGCSRMEESVTDTITRGADINSFTGFYLNKN